MTPIKDVIEKAGGLSVLGQHLGIKRQAVAQWRKVPASRVLKVSELTGYTPHELRPDLYPKELINS